ncbi:MAG: hypothetical protein R2706_19880 [Acidimicrobiales bacterium]
MLDVAPWANLVDGGPRNKVAVVRRSRLVHRLASEPSDQLFIGDYRSPFMQHLALRQPHDYVWLLDDGLGTIETWRRRTDPQAAVTRAAPSWLRQVLSAKLLRLESGDVERLRYFTFFNLTPSETELVTVNRLAWLRGRLPAGPPDERTLFLGSPFVEIGKMTEDHYVSLLASVAAQRGAIDYRPHRRENPHKLARLAQIDHLTVVDASGTIELVLTQQPTLPKQVLSFASSATYSIYKLVGDRVRVGTYALEPTDFLDDWFATGDGVPALLEQSGGKIALEAMPGRPSDYLSRYQPVTGES